MPHEDLIYFGDTKHMPYGEKTPDELLEYSTRILDFFQQKNAKAVVMACNTTSSVVYEKIKDKYPFKIYPIVQTVSKMLADLNVSKIGIFATPATVKSGVYKTEIHKYNPAVEVVQVSCPAWVKIVEDNMINEAESIEKIREKVVEIMKYRPDRIVLGCTHYPYLKSVIGNFVTEKIIIDPAAYFSEYIKKDLKSSHLLEKSEGSEEIYVSSNPEKFIKSSKMFFNTSPKVYLHD